MEARHTNSSLTFVVGVIATATADVMGQQRRHFLIKAAAEILFVFLLLQAIRDFIKHLATTIAVA